jgi:hypothetical protein
MNKKYRILLVIVIIIIICIGIYFFVFRKQNFTTKNIKGKTNNKKLSQLKKLRQIQNNKKRLNSLLRAAYLSDEKQVDTENVQDTILGYNYYLPDVNFCSFIFPPNMNKKIFKEEIYISKDSISDTLVKTFSNDNPLIQRVDLTDIENSFSFKTNINDIINSLGNKISLEEKMPLKVVNVKKTLNDILNNNTEPDVLLNNNNDDFCGLQFDTNKKTFGIYMLNELYSNENNINPDFINELVQLVNFKELQYGKGLEKDTKNSEGIWNNIEKDLTNPLKEKSNNIRVTEEYFNDYINFMKKWGSHIISDVTFGKSVSVWEVFNKNLPLQYNLENKKRIDLCKENCNKFSNPEKCKNNIKETFEYFTYPSPIHGYSTPTPTPTPTPVPYYSSFTTDDIINGLTSDLLKNPKLEPINYTDTTDINFDINDCKVNDWSQWSDCNVKCGGGNQNRTRKIIKEPNYGGETCPPLSDTKECNTQPCPINCEVGEWSQWSDCNVKCGGGTQNRSRNINVDTKYGGETCPPLSDTQECNTQPCPINCEVGDWSQWSDCNVKCGGGTQNRSRNINVDTKYGGETCPPLSETQECNTQPCPINCEVGDWGEWSKCSEDCDGGTQTRSRNINIDVKYGGETCPPLSETQECNTQPCVTCDSNFCSKTNYSIPYGSYCLKEQCAAPYVLENGKCNFKNNSSEESSNTLFLDKQNINCDKNSVLNGFHLNRTYNNKWYYDLDCINGGDLDYNNSQLKNTISNDDGAGNSMYLDRHYVDCGNNSVIKQFKLSRDGIDKYRYDYTCIPSNNPLSCREIQTGVTDGGSGNAINLDRQNIKCDQDEALNKFVLQNDGEGGIFYKYTCCKDPSKPFSCENENIFCKLDMSEESKNLLNKESMEYIKKLFKIKQAMYSKDTDESAFPANEVQDAKNLPTMKTINIIGSNEKQNIINIENNRIIIDNDNLMNLIKDTRDDKPIKYEYKPIWVILKELYFSLCVSDNINEKYIYNVQGLASQCTGIVSDSRYIDSFKNNYINLFANKNLPVEVKFETSQLAIDSLKDYDTKYLDIENFTCPYSNEPKYKLGKIPVPLKCYKFSISANFNLTNESYFGNGYNIKLLMNKIKIGQETYFEEYIKDKDLNFVLTFGITSEKVEDIRVSMIILDVNDEIIDLKFNINSLEDPNLYCNLFSRKSEKSTESLNNIELDIKFSLNIPIKDKIEKYLQYFEGKFILYKDKILLLGPNQLFGNKITNRQFYIPNNFTQIKNFSGSTTNGNINIGKVLNAGRFKSLRIRGIINKYDTPNTDTGTTIRVGQYTKKMNLVHKTNYLKNGDIISLINKDKNKDNQDIIVKLSSDNNITGIENNSIENNKKWIIRSINNSDVIKDGDTINIYSYDRGLQLLSNCNNPDKYPKEFRDCPGCVPDNNSCDPSSETYCSLEQKCYKKCKQNYHSEKGDNITSECSPNCVSDNNPLEIGFLGTKNDAQWIIQKINKNGDPNIQKDELVMLVSKNSICGNDYSYLTSNIDESNIIVSKHYQKEEIPKIIPEKFWAITAVAAGNHGCWWDNATNYLNDGWVACGTNIPTKPGLTNGPGDLNHDIGGPDAGLYVKYQLVDINSTVPILTGISTGNSNPDGLGICGNNVVQFIGGCTYDHPAEAGIISQTHGTSGRCDHYQACCVYYTPANKARTYINSIAISETGNDGVILNMRVELPDSPQVFTLSNNASTEDLHSSCGDDYSLYIVYSTNSIIKKAPNVIDFSSEGYTYVKKGCFTDKDPRAVPNFKGQVVNNVQECANIAKEDNKNVFALQYGGECWTGDSINDATRYGQLLYNKCIMDKTELGGASANIVYEKKYNEVNKRISDWKFNIAEEREFYMSIDIDGVYDLIEGDEINISFDCAKFTLSNLYIDVEVTPPSFISWNNQEYFSHPSWFELSRKSLFSYTFTTNHEISLDTGAYIYINSNELTKYFPNKNVSEFSPLPTFLIDKYNIEFWGYASSSDDRTYDIYNRFCKRQDNKRLFSSQPKRSIIQPDSNGIMKPSITTANGDKYYDVIYTDESDPENPKNIIEIFVPENAISIAKDPCKLLQGAYNLEAAYIFSSKTFCPYTKSDKYGDIQKIVPLDVDGAKICWPSNNCSNVVTYGCWNKASGCQSDQDCTGITTDEHINHTDALYGRGAGWIPDVHCPNRNCSNQQGIGFASWCDNSPTVPWDLNICSSDKDCGEDGEQWGGFCYPKCRDGYDNDGCCICSRMSGVDHGEYDRVKYCNQEQGLFYDPNSSPILGDPSSYRTVLSKPANISSDGTGNNGQYSCAADNARVNNLNEVIRDVAQVGKKGADCKCQNPYTIPGKSGQSKNATSNLLPDRLIWKQI